MVNVRRARTDARAYGKHGKAFRWMIVELHFNFGWNAREISRHMTFGGRVQFIHHATAYRILDLFNRTGDVVTSRGGRRRRGTSMTSQHWLVLLTYLNARPDLYLDEMRELVWADTGVLYSISTLFRALHEHDISVRVLKRMMAYRDEAEERAFIMAMSQLPASYFVFVDETAKDPRAIHRKRGRGVMGERTTVLDRYCPTIFFFENDNSYSPGRGKRLVGTGVLTLEGMVDYCIVRRRVGAKGVDAALCLEIFQQTVIPHLRPYPGPNSVLVMDNASIHHDPRLRRLVESTGARLYFLPVAANDLNPIEEAFAKLKSEIERDSERAQNDPYQALAIAFESITHVDAAGYFRHAGYSVETIIEGVLYA